MTDPFPQDELADHVISDCMHMCLVRWALGCCSCSILLTCLHCLRRVAVLRVRGAAGARKAGQMPQVQGDSQKDIEDFRVELEG